MSAGLFVLLFFTLVCAQENLEDKNVVKIPVKDRFESETASILKEQEDFLVLDKFFGLAPDMRAPGDCGFQYTGLKPGEKGTIQTPNYPENYPPDIQCIWWLKVTISSNCLKLLVDDFLGS